MVSSRLALKALLAVVAGLSLLCLSTHSVFATTVNPALPVHSKVWKADPGIGSTITQVPTKVTVFALENINPDPAKSNLQVYGPSADATDTLISHGNAQVSLSDPKEMSITLTSNNGHINGVYVVFWKTVSADDGDPATGSFSFTVKTNGAGIDTAPTTDRKSVTSPIGLGMPLWVTIVVAFAALFVGLGAGWGLSRYPRPAMSSLAAMRASISQEGEKETTKRS